MTREEAETRPTNEHLTAYDRLERHCIKTQKLQESNADEYVSTAWQGIENRKLLSPQEQRRKRSCTRLTQKPPIGRHQDIGSRSEEKGSSTKWMEESSRRLRWQQPFRTQKLMITNPSLPIFEAGQTEVGSETRNAQTAGYG
jgi:hypothetical protein